ncbi:Rid family detoxifying hydrolase [Candidatus Gracilibacteria bacterium]|jgi:2-iminobutanoate/2-iminopropanoate deaminase|nr:Rid family detoxifying hydrolase [Candidatus Gracilibacteria bacterium]
MFNMVNAANAPAAIGPYSHAVKVGDLVFLSGQLPLVPETMLLIEGGIKPQVQQALANIAAVLEELGAAKAAVVKTTVFLQNMTDFPDFNEVYADFFGEHKPARSTVEVARLPKDALVEIEVIVSLA